jgi:hypothetical protein
VGNERETFCGEYRSAECRLAANADFRGAFDGNFDSIQDQTVRQLHGECDYPPLVIEIRFWFLELPNQSFKILFESSK